jgi:hypothetical protein
MSMIGPKDVYSAAARAVSCELRMLRELILDQKEGDEGMTEEKNDNSDSMDGKIEQVDPVPFDKEWYSKEIAPLVDKIIEKCGEKRLACFLVFDDGCSPNGTLAESIMSGGNVSYSPAIDMMHSFLVSVISDEEIGKLDADSWISKQVGTA